MSEDFVGGAGNRSDSDNGRYVGVVARAARCYEAFQTFKRDPDYTQILEHLGESEGYLYLGAVLSQAPHLLAHIEAVKANDEVGGPVRYDYPGIGWVSPTTLRYLKVASDLLRLFGDLDGARIAEVGVGYGGQALVLDKLARPRAYVLFDLPPVLALASRCLEAHVLRTAYRPVTLNQFEAGEPFDLVVSNYAFSELPVPLQRRYIDKVLAPARRGYLTMNQVPGTAQKLTVEALRGLLPPFEVHPEVPRTAPGNYLIVWGARGEGRVDGR